jgi:hypothetical protein
MTRYVDNARTLARLRDEALAADQKREDLERALEDSERVCDRYREALVHIDQIVGVHHVTAMNADKIQQIVKDAMWTKVKEAS